MQPKFHAARRPETRVSCCGRLHRVPQAKAKLMILSKLENSLHAPQLLKYFTIII